MRDRHSLPVRVCAALSGLLLLASTGVVLVRYGLGAFDGGYRLTATFDRSSQGLDDDSTVKLRGVDVGKVTGIHLRQDGRAEVTMHLDAGVRVADTTAASIDPLSVFGPSFLDLSPGAHETSGPFLGDGDRIRHTATPLEFTRVLDKVDVVLRAIDPQDVATIFGTFADSVAGLGPQLRRTLESTVTLVDLAHRHLPEASLFLQDLHTLSGSLVQHSGSIQQTITNLGEVLPSVGARTDQIGRLLEGSAEVAGSLAGYLDQHRAAIGTLLPAAATVLGVGADHVDQFPDLFRLVDEFFGRIGDALRLQGPGGVLIGALHGGLYSSICANLNLPDPCQLVNP